VDAGAASHAERIMKVIYAGRICIGESR